MATIPSVFLVRAALPNVPAQNMVQVGIGDWEIPREVVKGASEREINIITMGDMEKMDVDNTVKMAWNGINMVYMSFDIDSTDYSFMPGTGSFLTREALALASKVAADGICGAERV